MDLIYVNTSKDESILTDYTLDIAFGNDENDFEIKCNINNNVLDYQYLFYVSEEDKESQYGGIIDSIVVNTKDNTITYGGRSFQGILSSKIIQPDNGQDYYVVSGNVCNVARSLISRVGLDDLFVVNNSSSKSIVSYQFDRYIDLYTGIKKMAKTLNLKVKMAYFDGHIYINFNEIVDYSDDEEWDSSQMTLTVSNSKNYVNHLICLGKGELKDREVIHLYRDNNDSIVSTKYYDKLDEICNVYENTSTDTLLEDSTTHFKEIIEDIKNTSIDFDAKEYNYDIGDVVGVRENLTNTFVRREIVKTILKIANGKETITYSIG